jgi:hypothetical protein
LNLFKQMAEKSPRIQNAIAFVLLFGMGALVLFVVGSDFSHWYATGELYFKRKYEHGSYTSYGEAPGMFVAALAMDLIYVVAGVALIVAAFLAPSQFRKKQQARLASPEKSPPHPWRPE